MRRDGRPKKTQNIVLCREQRLALEVISERTLGKPGFSGLIGHAIDAFVQEQIRRDPDIAVELTRRQAVESAAGNVVPIRAKSSDKGGI